MEVAFRPILQTDRVRQSEVTASRAGMQGSPALTGEGPPGSQTQAPRRQAPTPTYLSSLSSRLTSFFCLRVSSRLRRASASSLTARSRSRLRLSQSVLAEKAEADVTVRGGGRGLMAYSGLQPQHPNTPGACLASRHTEGTMESLEAKPPRPTP